MSQAKALFEETLRKRLGILQRKDRLRDLCLPRGLDLTSNDYLGLRHHQGIRRKLISWLEQGGALGSGGSRLLGGNTVWHEQAESCFARFKGTEAALIFNSGFDANVGVISTLCGAGDAIFYDELIHASMIDGMRSSKARSLSFKHNNLNHLEDQLKDCESRGRRFVLVESLYSMDGDTAPLNDLASLVRQYDLLLIVDEAHATGVFGPKGAGVLEESGLCDLPLVTVHTCGKAWGSAGAFVACSAEVRRYLINQCRPLIFSTSLPPIFPLHWMAVLEVLEQEPWRRERVRALADRFRREMEDLIDFGSSGSPIIPVILGSDGRAVAASNFLRSRGFDVRAVRPPAVPRGKARIRLTLNAEIKDRELSDVMSAFREYFRSEEQAIVEGKTKRDAEEIAAD